MTLEFNTQLYIKDLANLAVQEIYKLPDKYKDIAICIFLNEMTIAETSSKLGIPVSTVGKRKIKIQKILKNILKNGEKIF
jgi:DNA-directed RNA polymerase specialized sigma subunit